eukprot:s1076_g4.t2
MPSLRWVLVCILTAQVAVARNCSERSGGAFVTIRVGENESVSPWVEDQTLPAADEDFIEAAIAHAVRPPGALTADKSSKAVGRIPVFHQILSGSDCDGWSWHVDPKNVGWAELAVEVCDASPRYIEEHSEAWRTSPGRWCPWKVQVAQEPNPRMQSATCSKLRIGEASAQSSSASLRCEALTLSARALIQGARAAVQLPKRPHSMQSHSRSLGQSGTMSNFGSTLGSTFGKSDVARQISKQDPKSMAQGGLSGTAQLSQSGTSTATGANFVPWTKALGSVIASPGKLASPKTKASKLAGKAKCSPDVRRAFRSKPVEKCSCATITAVWSACDTFWEIDTTHSGAITRQVYMDFLKYICPTVNTLRMLRRARLECRFRCSAVPVRLEDFLAMVWPNATIEDTVAMFKSRLQVHTQVQCSAGQRIVQRC